MCENVVSFVLELLVTGLVVEWKSSQSENPTIKAFHLAEVSIVLASEVAALNRGWDVIFLHKSSCLNGMTVP